jgi:uncharacterized protein (DUF433 family)
MATIKPAASPTEVEETELDAMVEQDPRRPGRHNARMRDYGTHVWALIAALQGNNWDMTRVAAEYHMPEVAIRAAIRYYEQNREFIDAELLLQHEEYISG